MNKKLTAILLAMLMVAPTVLTACSESTENAETTASAQTTTNEATAGETETESDETERRYADVPADSNFGGYSFNILCSSNSEYGGVQDDFYAEEITGEGINDARYNRNTTVGDKLNVTINPIDAEVGEGNGYTMISQSVQAGTGDYDLATACGYTTTRLAQNNFLYDMKNVPYIDLSAPWWDQVANNSMQILGQLFFTTGEISTADNDATYCIMFNKQLIDDYNLQNPYDLVYSDKWTMDNFISMALQVSEDLDANGKFDLNDRYGALIWDDSMMGVVNASGEKCCIINNDGLLELSLNSETTIDAVTKFLDFAVQKEYACAYQRLNWDDTALVRMFSGNQGLFLMQLIQIVPKMREMDANFGILPYFKYTESQKDYYTTIGSWHSVFVCVPNGQADLERTGIVTECLANEGLYGLTKEYYEKTLVGKSTRDQESEGMLDIIFANRVYDMGWYFQVGSYNEQVMNLLRNYNNNFASMYKSMEKVANKVIDKANETFEKNLEESR